MAFDLGGGIKLNPEDHAGFVKSLPTGSSREMRRCENISPGVAHLWGRIRRLTLSLVKEGCEAAVLYLMNDL